MVLTTEAQQSVITNIVSPKTSIGYKMTEFGFIPDDWHQATLGDKTIKIGSGITPTGGERIYKQSGRPFLRSQNIGNGHLLLDAIAYIDEETHESFKSTEVKAKDVLLNITGASIGRCAVADERVQDGNVNQHVCIIRTNKNELDSDFLNYFLLSSAGQSQIDSFQAGGNREGLNFGQIRSFTLPCPSLKEQMTIAAALKDMDSMINSLDQLIAKKQNLKLATMQQLLTGKQRLPGFSEKWEKKKLGSIAHINMGQSPDSKYYNVNRMGMPLIQGNADIKNRKSIYRVWTSDITKTCDKGDLILTVRAPVGLIGIATGASCLGRGVCSLKPIMSVSNDFLFHTMVFAEENWKILEQGSTFTSANSAQIAEFSIMIPNNIDEQKAIVNILSDMDTELFTLEKQLDKARNLKQGMMQELLTGRIRLT